MEGALSRAFAPAVTDLRLKCVQNLISSNAYCVVVFESRRYFLIFRSCRLKLSVTLLTPSASVYHVPGSLPFPWDAN